MFHHAVEKISTHVLLQNRPGTHVSIVDTASARLKFIIDEDGLIPAKKDGNFNSKLLYWADDLPLFHVSTSI